MLNNLNGSPVSQKFVSVTYTTTDLLTDPVALFTLPADHVVTKLRLRIVTPFNASGDNFVDIGYGPGSNNIGTRVDVSQAGGTVIDLYLKAIKQCPLDSQQTVYLHYVTSGNSPTTGSLQVEVLFYRGAQPETTPTTPANVVAPSIVYTGAEPNVTDPLVCQPGEWSGFPIPLLTYQWKLNGVDIPGEVYASLIAGISALGGSVSCVVTATNSQGSSSVETGSVVITEAIAPSFASGPTISGAAVVGSDLIVDISGLVGSPVPSVTYQWQRDSVDIPGETASTYTTVEGDVGSSIRCVVTAINYVGSVTVASNTIQVQSGDVIDVLFPWLHNWDATKVSGSGDASALSDRGTGDVSLQPVGTVQTGGTAINGLNTLSLDGTEGLKAATAQTAQPITIFLVCRIGS